MANPVCNGFKANMWSVGVVIYAVFARGLPFMSVTREFDFVNAAVDDSVIPPAFRPLVESGYRSVRARARTPRRCGPFLR
jgi:hypothetical protein